MVYGVLINYVPEQSLLFIGAIFASGALFIASYFIHSVLILSLTLGIAHGKNGISQYMRLPYTSHMALSSSIKVRLREGCQYDKMLLKYLSEIN